MLPKAKKYVKRRCISFQGVQLWNSADFQNHYVHLYLGVMAVIEKRGKELCMCMNMYVYVHILYAFFFFLPT